MSKIEQWKVEHPERTYVHMPCTYCKRGNHLACPILDATGTWLPLCNNCTSRAIKTRKQWGWGLK